MRAARILVASFGLALFAWLIPSSIEISAWSRGGLDRVALFAPLYTLWIALAAGAALSALLWWGGARTASARGRRAALVAPASALWLCLVSFLPWAPDRFPLLLLFAGPLKWALAAAVAVAIALRWYRGRSVRSDLPARPASRGGRIAWLPVFALSLALFLFFGLKSLSVVGLGGDEPHYLIITHSLLVDHDIKIENNHARGDYRAFFPGDLKPDYLQRGVNGEIYSIHAPGLAALMLPGYALAGSRGAVATVCLLAAVAASAIFEAAFLLGGVFVAWATWASVCLSIPFVPHAWALYPEMAGATVSALVVLWSLRSGVPGPAAWFLRGLVLATLPWMHTKFAVLLAVLTVWLLIELRGQIKESIALLAPIVVSGVLWLSFFYVVYGTIDPQAPYGGHTAEFVRAANIPRSLLGLLIDQKFGLLVYAPIYLAAAAGAWLLMRDRERRGLAWFLVIATILYSLSSGREYMWWGGSSAPARYLVPILPLLAPLVAIAFARLNTAGQEALVATLAAIGIVISFLNVADLGRLLVFSSPHGVARLFEIVQGGAPLTASFPTFTDENWTLPLIRGLPWLVAAGAAIIVAAASGAKRSRFWTMVAACASFVVLASVLARPLAADAKLESATRGRMALMTDYDPKHLRAFDYGTRSKMTPAQWIAAGGVTVDLDPAQPVDGYGRLAGPLALPPGTYTATVWFEGNRPPNGDLLLALGGGQTLRRVEGPLPNPVVVPFEMPVAVPSLWVQLTDVATAQRALKVEIKPEALVPASERLDVDARAVETVPGRQGAYMEYTNEWSFPEGGVFWTRGTGEASLIVVPAGANEMVLTLHVGPNAGSVRLAVGKTAQEIPMRAEETRDVSIPLAAGTPYVELRARAPADFRPADVDSSSADTRRLGCQIRVQVR